MEKAITLWILLLPQPMFAYAFWFSMQKLFKWLGLEEGALLFAVILSSAILYAIFAFLFTKGFLASDQAKKLGL